MNVLFAASECAPFIKTGGLGDVIQALPKALKKAGIHPAVILPKYEDLKPEVKARLSFMGSLTVPVGWRKQYCGIETLEEGGSAIIFWTTSIILNGTGVTAISMMANGSPFFACSA